MLLDTQHLFTQLTLSRMIPWAHGISLANALKVGVLRGLFSSQTTSHWPCFETFMWRIPFVTARRQFRIEDQQDRPQSCVEFSGAKIWTRELIQLWSVAGPLIPRRRVDNWRIWELRLWWFARRLLHCCILIIPAPATPWNKVWNLRKKWHSQRKMKIECQSHSPFASEIGPQHGLRDGKMTGIVDFRLAYIKSDPLDVGPP